mgnify:FL=1
MDFETQLRYEQEKKSEALAALLSLVVPGIGSMYEGHIGKGFMFLIGAIIGYVALVIPGIIIHLFSIVSAYNDTKTYNTLVGLKYVEKK